MSTFLSLPVSIRKLIYAQVIRAQDLSPLTAFSLPFVNRQIQSEFVTAYDYHVNARFRCSFGRTARNGTTIKFYSSDYHTQSSGNNIEVSAWYVAHLKACVVRCTIESLPAHQRRSETGFDCFQECINSLVRVFKGCQSMRDLKISFDSFLLVGRKGALKKGEVWERLRDLAEIRGLQEIRFETPGFEEDYTWRKQKVGGKKKPRAPRDRRNGVEQDEFVYVQVQVFPKRPKENTYFDNMW